MATPEFPPLFCGLYLPGHEVHWIQGLKFSDLDHPRTEGTDDGGSPGFRAGDVERLEVGDDEDFARGDGCSASVARFDDVGE